MDVIDLVSDDERDDASVQSAAISVHSSESSVVITSVSWSELGDTGRPTDLGSVTSSIYTDEPVPAAQRETADQSFSVCSSVKEARNDFRHAIAPSRIESDFASDMHQHIQDQRCLKRAERHQVSLSSAAPLPPIQIACSLTVDSNTSVVKPAKTEIVGGKLVAAYSRTRRACAAPSWAITKQKNRKNERLRRLDALNPHAFRKSTS
jgi:hypothetical protein